MKKETTRNLIILILICIVFIIQSISLEYTQDDAYISYRYVENFVEGHGLVFNYGERVEGYTNFLWIMILSIAISIGLPILLTSQILGVIFGVGTLIISYLLSKEFCDYKRWYLAFITPILLSLNGALAYWAIGGLETGLFIFLTSLIIYLEIKQPSLNPYVLVIATLTRPEGGLLFGIIFLYRLFVARKGIKALAIFSIIYFGLLLPYAVFKLIYFGNLLPNPFYAKTGFSIEYFLSGLEYFWHFAYHYGMFGLIFFLPFVFFRKMSNVIRLILMTSLIYTLYIIMVGGDVLKAHRFFLPILPLLYSGIVFVAVHIFKAYKNNIILKTISGVIVVVAMIWTLVVPYNYIQKTRYLEKQLIDKMHEKAKFLKANDKSNFSLATTTIGKVSYELKGHKVIDMLGLTDPHIAKNPEKIEGFNTTWKERNFNSSYLLGLRPDYIMFSTGYKPSAPAERALVLNSQFRKNYSTICFTKPESNILTAIWKKYGDFSEPNEVYENIEYVDLIHDSFQYFSKGDFKSAETLLNKAVSEGPDDFSLPYQLLGTCYLGQKEVARMMKNYQSALEIDSNNLETRINLFLYFKARGDTANQNYMRIEVKRLAPWFNLD
jgi:arabinofuranosyltransferase